MLADAAEDGLHTGPRRLIIDRGIFDSLSKDYGLISDISISFDL